MAVFTSSVPSTMRATASVIGMSMPFSAATPEATEAILKDIGLVK